MTGIATASTVTITNGFLLEHQQTNSPIANSAMIFNTQYMGNFYNTIGFNSGPTAGFSPPAYSWGVGGFGERQVGFQSPQFGLWDQNGKWWGGFTSVYPISSQGVAIGFAINASSGTNNLDVGGRMMVGADFTSTAANNCGAGVNQPCGANAPTNGLGVEGDTVLGTVSEVSGNSQFQVAASTSDKYAIYVSTPSGAWVVDISTNGTINFRRSQA